MRISHDRTALTSLCAWSLSWAMLANSAVAEPAFGYPSAAVLAMPSWHPPASEAVSQQLELWLAAQPIEPAIRQQIWSHWEDSLVEYSNETARLEALATALAAGDRRAKELVEYCRRPNGELTPAKFEWLSESSVAPLVRDSLRLIYGRWLVEVGFYDEALASLEGLSVSDVVAPATLLYTRAVAHHQLVHADEVDALAQQLLERPDDLPRRYRHVAELMRRDVADLKIDSLDHIARRMADIQRRLDKGRSGASVQQVEQDVIAALDKLIEDLEKQQQRMQQQSQLGGTPSGTPMEDSRPAELKAPGKVDPRDLGGFREWGDLPPKEREQALQQLGREFPAHYRELIEQYFRELANEPSTTPLQSDGP
jgi:hypothetical protein